jgi:hypothetical protein
MSSSSAPEAESNGVLQNVPGKDNADLEAKQGGNEETGSKSVVREEISIDTTLPINWSVKKKWLNLGIAAIICFVTAFGSSVYTPAIPDVMKDFGVSETVALLPLTTYVLGLSFGP